MLADPAMAVVKMNGTPAKKDSKAMLLWDTRNKDVYIMPGTLPKPADGKQYQLWALVDGKPMDAGVLELGCNGVCKMKNIKRADGFAITLEKAGGSPVPTLAEMFVSGNI
jgi:anti-sigma-K factor RskA